MDQSSAPVLLIFFAVYIVGIPAAAFWAGIARGRRRATGDAYRQGYHQGHAQGLAAGQAKAAADAALAPAPPHPHPEPITWPTLRKLLRRSRSR